MEKTFRIYKYFCMKEAKATEYKNYKRNYCISYFFILISELKNTNFLSYENAENYIYFLYLFYK